LPHGWYIVRASHAGCAFRLELSGTKFGPIVRRWICGRYDAAYATPVNIGRRDISLGT